MAFVGGAVGWCKEIETLPSGAGFTIMCGLGRSRRHADEPFVGISWPSFGLPSAVWYASSVAGGGACSG
jgi:hypothetical protein